MIVGQTISHYRIVEKLGEGGMGVVYKAEDTKLERTVALKFLAAHLLNDEEAKARFLREAKAAAALHHPNICPVYEIDEVDGKTFLSMAFLEGEALEERIAEGPMALKDALDIGRQVSEGLEAAHEKGIVHRDIKPANIMVDAKGRATIMDFGLARLTEASRLTKVDTAMGTVAYMSPEQAQGMEVDSRTDLWALGCVLYEMVSGQRPFQGQYDQALLYEIVHEEPEPLTGLRTGVPVELEFAVGKCLEKEADSRYQTAREIVVDLKNLQDKLRSGRSTILRTAQMTGAVPAKAAQTVNPAQALPPDSVVMPRSKQRILLAVAVVGTLAMLVLGYLRFTQRSTPATDHLVRRFSFGQAGLGAAGISPDGRYIAFTARADGRSSVWLRPVGSETARELAGTTGALLARQGPIAWSPDSRSIVFGVQGQLRRAEIDGSEATTLAELPGNFHSASWSPDGEQIVFASGFRLFEVSSRGGEPRQLLEADVGHYHAFPHFLPGDESSRTLLFMSAVGYDPHVEALNLDTGERREILDEDGPVVYDPSGHLLFTRDNAIWATRFSTETLTPIGEAFPVADSAAAASIARNGDLVYADSRRASLQVAITDRDGELLRTVGPPIPNGFPPALSPSTKSIAISTGGDIWMFDVERDAGSRLYGTPDNEAMPVWVSSDAEISYVALAARQLLIQTADGSAPPRVLTDDLAGSFDWSQDGRYLAYTDNQSERGVLLYRERNADGSLSEPALYQEAPALIGVPQFSPDGRYLAYLSQESGRTEVYVRPFPEGPGRWRISTNGGTQARWSSDGEELFYVEGATLMAVPVATDPSLSFGAPKALFENGRLRGENSWRYDVYPDGQRFVVTTPVEGADEEPTVHIVLNWYEEIRDREQ